MYIVFYLLHKEPCNVDVANKPLLFLLSLLLTVLPELSIDELEGLPTNNLIGEILLFIKFKKKTT